jgi:hypothetical protein
MNRARNKGIEKHDVLYFWMWEQNNCKQIGSLKKQETILYIRMNAFGNDKIMRKQNNMLFILFFYMKTQIYICSLFYVTKLNYLTQNAPKPLLTPLIKSNTWHH